MRARWCTGIGMGDAGERAEGWAVERAEGSGGGEAGKRDRHQTS